MNIPDKSEQERGRDQSRIYSSTLVPETHESMGPSAPLMILRWELEVRTWGPLTKIQWWGEGQSFWPVWLWLFGQWRGGSLTSCHLNHAPAVCFASINSFNPRKLVTETVSFCSWDQQRDEWFYKEVANFIFKLKSTWFFPAGIYHTPIQPRQNRQCKQFLSSHTQICPLTGLFIYRRQSLLVVENTEVCRKCAGNSKCGSVSCVWGLVHWIEPWRVNRSLTGTE